MNITVVIVGVVVAILLWVALNYNRLVQVRLHVRESWSDIDTELKRRYDLVPNLVETVKGYAAHERELLTEVTEARARALASNGRRGTAGRRREAPGGRHAPVAGPWSSSTPT